MQTPYEAAAKEQSVSLNLFLSNGVSSVEIMGGRQ